MFKREAEYRLSEPIDYHCNGQLCRTDLLVLKAPTEKQRRTAPKIKEMISKALFSMVDLFKKNVQDKSTVEQPENNEAPDAKAVLKTIEASNAVSFVEFREVFRELLKDGCCMIEGKVVITDYILDAMLAEEYDALIGVYIQNFMLTS